MKTKWELKAQCALYFCLGTKTFFSAAVQLLKSSSFCFCKETSMEIIHEASNIPSEIQTKARAAIAALSLLYDVVAANIAAAREKPSLCSI